MIDSLMSDKTAWYTYWKDGNYTSEVSIWNEYATHALYCIYAKETFPDAVYQRALADRFTLMERRGFPNFEAVTQRIMEVYKREGKSFGEIYPKGLAAMEGL